MTSASLTFLVASTCALLVHCKEAPKAATAQPDAAAASSPSSPTGSGCEAARKKLAECGISPAKTNLGDPCDERVGACLAGQGCEAIRKNETGCVFH